MWEPPGCRRWARATEVLGQAAAKTKKQRQREEEAFQGTCVFDHAITDELRARATERQQKDDANDRKRLTIAQRNKRRLAVMDRQAPWSKFNGKKAWVDIQNRVDGDFPVVSRRMAPQGIEVLGWGDLGPSRYMCGLQI